ncbi:hypothetical protein BH10ACT2_BH10ACT2_08380 [soil metagenome]
MPVTTDSFDGFVCRDELATFVANAAVGGAPFARALTPLPTTRGGVAFPVVSPDSFGWVSEGGAIPEVNLHDDSYVVAVAKLAGLVTMSSEFVDDAELPLSQLLADAVADSMGPALDFGLLFGSGAPEPLGIIAAAIESTIGPDFRSSVINAFGELIDRGANAESIVAFASGSVVAYELGRTNDHGTPIHQDGAQAMLGPSIRLIAIPSLSAGETLVADVSRLFLVLRDDFEAKFSDHAGFKTDEVVMRVKGRFTVACPTPAKALRVIPNAS